ncbi:MAG: lysozyme inhibitor LprI family protein, partial [Pseudomonadota bacterium]
VCFLLVALVVPGFAQSTEAEIKRYGDVLESCYSSAAEDALPDCIGRMAEACMIQEDGGQTTLGMTMCTMAEAQKWDNFLNSEYKATLSGLAAMDRDEAEYFPEFAKRVEALRTVQRAWIAFRDAECGLSYAMWGSGSMRNIAASKCRLEMTATRTIELRNLGSEMR